MNRNFFKIIFILLIIILGGIAIYTNFYNKGEILQAEEFKPVSTEKIVKSNNIRIGIIEFDNLNPILSNNKNVQDISRLIFDPLFILTQDYKLEGSLATECSKLDDFTYIIKLREDVKWHDGNEFNVWDVIFTIDMLKNEENNSIYRYNVSNIAGLEEIDEYTLKIILNEKVEYFEYNLIFPIVSSKYFNEENFKYESKNLKPPGTGMFYVSDITNNNILLKRNIDGWKKENLKLDSINLNLYNSLSSTINGFKNQEIDIFTTSNKNIEEYLKNTDYIKQEYINRNYSYIVLNCNNKVLNNIEVRQAINSAINKEEIIKDIYGKRYRQSNFPLDFGSYAYDTNNIVIVPDKNVSKALLVDNGWKYSSKKWRKTVNYRYLSIELNLLVNKDVSNMVKVAKKIKEQLESVGIAVKIIEAKNNQYNRYLNNKQYDLALVNSNYGYSPSLDKYFGENNLANYSNEEIINILNGIENITDENELNKQYSRIAEIYNDEVPYISLYYNTNNFIYSSSLKGSIMPNSYNLFCGIQNWYREYKK